MPSYHQSPLFYYLLRNGFEVKLVDGSDIPKKKATPKSQESGSEPLLEAIASNPTKRKRLPDAPLGPREGEPLPKKGNKNSASLPARKVKLKAAKLRLKATTPPIRRSSRIRQQSEPSSCAISPRAIPRSQACQSRSRKSPPLQGLLNRSLKNPSLKNQPLLKKKTL